jgi:hypothetical protein
VVQSGRRDVAEGTRGPGCRQRREHRGGVRWSAARVGEARASRGSGWGWAVAGPGGGWLLGRPE